MKKGHIANLLLVIIVFILSGYIVFDLVSEKKTTEPALKDNCLPVEENLKEVIVLYDEKFYGKRVVIDSNRNLVIDGQIIDTGIKYYTSTVATTNICFGNTYSVFIKEDNTISAFSNDDLFCGEELKYVKNVNGLTNVRSFSSSIIRKVGYDIDVKNVVNTYDNQEIIIEDFSK